ncbi:sodium/glucose cotransporter 1-like isoform X2 [Cervus canadensis]|uniref:sodium/glucose cotransporter 1-like isoform X2 n=1 Tax=Cervus canadensis TaxID=1574408 RepID=UPI001C9E1D9E|nr:sodium/glucose cotransporter 1-like isoform X2 [Cervus canadensis]
MVSQRAGCDLATKQQHRHTGYRVKQSCDSRRLLPGWTKPSVVAGAFLFASNIGTGHFMGLAGKGASSGIAVGAFEWNAAFILCVLGWVFSPIYIKSGVVTLPRYLRKRFGGYRIQFLLAILYLLIYIFSKISVEICTGAVFMRLVLGLDVYLATVILLSVTGIYSITGGFAAVVYTDILHASFVVLGSVLLMGYAFHEIGGYQELQSRYPEAKPTLTWEGNWTAPMECLTPRVDAFHIFRDPVTGDIPWPGIVFGLSTISLYYWCADQIFVQGCLAGKSLSHVKGGCVLCGFLKLLPMFSIVMPGMISRVLYTDKVACVVPSECKKYCGIRTSCTAIAYPLLVAELLPSGVRGLVVSALWASLMSSLTAVYSSASAVFTMDIYPRIRPTATKKELMITGRFFVIVLLAVSIAWVPALQVAHRELLFEHMQTVLSYLTPPVAALFLLAVFCKRVTEQGAFWGLASGLVIGSCRMVSEFAYGPWTCSMNRKCPRIICGVHYLYFAMILFAISLVTVLGVSMFTVPIPDKHLHRLCWSLRNSREERVDLDEDAEVKIPEPQAQPDVFIEAKGCLWKAWDVFCGLELLPSPKLAPEEVVVPETEQNDMPGGTARSDTEGTEEREAPQKQPFWNKALGLCGIVLVSLMVLFHIYFY